MPQSTRRTFLSQGALATVFASASWPNVANAERQPIGGGGSSNGAPDLVAIAGIDRAEPLHAVVMTAIATVPGDRFASADAFAEPVVDKPLKDFFAGIAQWRERREGHRKLYEDAKRRTAAHEDTLKQIHSLEARLAERHLDQHTRLRVIVYDENADDVELWQRTCARSMTNRRHNPWSHADRIYHDR